MHKKEVELVFVTLCKPILVGVYEEKKLLESLELHEKSSEILPILYASLDKKYTIKALFYANGPGSFMAIKIAYIFLKSMSVLKKIPLFSVNAFYFNKNAPIKALGKLYFVKVAQDIKTQKFETSPESIFSLPITLKSKDFSTKIAPLYVIGAV